MNHPTKLPLITITAPLPDFGGFASLLQHGVLFAVDHPVPAQNFLLSIPGFTEDYIEQAVQTVFINGVAADSLDRDLPAGSIIALSAAMPGLAGAIFRRQGVHGSLRSRPTVPGGPPAKECGFITLKLFNSIASDRVLDLLTHGVTIHGKAVHDFAIRQANLFHAPTVLAVDGQQTSYEELLRVTSASPRIRMQAVVPTTSA